MSIPVPKKIIGKKINVIEFVPIYDGWKYQIHYKYEDNIEKKMEKKEIKIKDHISIDLGINNLMTIYDPSGKQKIISGKYLVKMNHIYNSRISKLKSAAKKCNKKDSTNKIKTLLQQRQRKINSIFNLIVKWFEQNYKEITIVVGYNTNCKKGLNMGRYMNRKFYQIPYLKLLNKLKFKMKCIGSEVIVNEESYTSKCDSLALKHIGKKTKYLGRRCKRGLYSSSKNKLINADINGAINILRKYLRKKKITMNKIMGKSLFNPIRVNIYREVTQKRVSTSG